MGRRLSLKTVVALFLCFGRVLSAQAKADVSNSTLHSWAPAWDANVPIAFSCDSLQVDLSKHEQSCLGHVHVTQGLLHLCCDTLVVVTDESSGRVRLLRLLGDVRASQAENAMWADKVLYAVADHTLVLSGRPLLKRATSQMRGSCITFDLTNQHAKIEKPLGFWSQANDTVSGADNPASRQKGPCPLLPRPSE